MSLQTAKDCVRRYIDTIDQTPLEALVQTLADHISPTYKWRGVHPFNELVGMDAVVQTVWAPLRESFRGIQRRMDFFFAGQNQSGLDARTWVINAGHFMGLFDTSWLGIPSTGKLTTLRYAEFHCVNEGVIEESALFLDILSVMDQAGVYPLPPMTGSGSVFPGPRTHDGLLFTAQPIGQGQTTLALVNQMIADLNELNISGEKTPSPKLLERAWHDDMAWYGSAGIGATYTIERYSKQHQLPFRQNLTDKTFNGHVARIAEGNYCGFFGWPNLHNRNTGGFLGLPASDVQAPMRVVDLYRREGDKLAENWVYFDFLHYLHAQGLDVLKRCQDINRT